MYFGQKSEEHATTIEKRNMEVKNGRLCYVTKKVRFSWIFLLFKRPGRAHMGPYGPIWAYMGPCGPLWAHMDPKNPEKYANKFL